MNQLTKNEYEIFKILNNSLINEKYLFLGSNLHLKLLVT